MKFLRNLFVKEWLYRTFIAMQITSIIVIIILDNASVWWDFLPYINQYGNELTWDFIKARSWEKHPFQNSVAFVGIFALPISLIINWILSTEEK